MPVIKCPSCEYRNTHTAGTCVNCGESLPLQPSTVRRPPTKDRPAPRPKPTPGEEGIPRTKPVPHQETQRLDPAQMREHLSAKHKPNTSDEHTPKPKPVPHQETQRLDPAQMREHLSAKHKPNTSDEHTPKPKPAPHQETQRLDPAQMREHLAAKHKPSTSDERVPKPKPVPRQQTQRLDPAQMREHLAAKHKPSTSDERIPKPKPAPHQETQRLDSAQMREHLAAKHKPNTSDEQTPSIRSRLRERRISTNGSHSRVETHSEAKVEMPSEVESSPQAQTVESYPETKSYSQDESYSEDESSSRELVPYYQDEPESTALVPSISTALEPYNISTMIEQIHPEGLLPALPTLFKEEKNFEPGPDDKLPWGFPHRPPDVAGKIILINQSQELPDYPNVILGLVNMLTELIWMIPNDTMKKEEERLQITIVRVRTSKDGEKEVVKDVRLIGYLRGANLTLGDIVWFWGWHRKGSLLVKKGYNWTSKAIVETHSMGLILPAMVVLILLGIGLLLFVSWPAISSGLSAFFLIAPHKP